MYKIQVSIVNRFDRGSGTRSKIFKNILPPFTDKCYIWSLADSSWYCLLTWYNQWSGSLFTTSASTPLSTAEGSFMRSQLVTKCSIYQWTEEVLFQPINVCQICFAHDLLQKPFFVNHNLKNSTILFWKTFFYLHSQNEKCYFEKVQKYYNLLAELFKNQNFS